MTNWVNGRSDYAGVVAELPTILPAYEALYASFWQQSHIDTQCLELCRLRLAQLHRCEPEWFGHACTVSAAQREALANWPGSELFSAAHRACLAFAEVYAMDAQAITDDQAEAVKSHYGDAGLVALIEALGVFDGMTRLTLMLGTSISGEGGDEQ